MFFQSFDLENVFEEAKKPFDLQYGFEVVGKTSGFPSYHKF